MGRCTEPVDPGKAWDQSAESGFDVGPIFRGVSQIMMGSSEATYIATIPDTAACMPYNYESEYILHPIGLDSLFQAPVFFPTTYGGEQFVPYMPVAIQEITILTDSIWKAGSQMKIFALSSGGDNISRIRVYDYAGVDAQGICGVLIKGIVEVPIRFSQIVQDGNNSRCLRVQWEPCVSLWTPRQFEKVLASSSPELSEVDEFKMLEDLSYHYIKQALQETDPKLAVPHLVRLLDCMRRQAQLQGDKNGILVHAGECDPRVLLESAKTLNSTMSLICDVGEKLPAILQGEIDPLSLTTPIDRCTFGGRPRFPRTGTSSLKAAMEILGFDPCHDMSLSFRSNFSLQTIMHSYIHSPTGALRPSQKESTFRKPLGRPLETISRRIQIPSRPYRTPHGRLSRHLRLPGLRRLSRSHDPLSQRQSRPLRPRQ